MTEKSKATKTEATEDKGESQAADEAATKAVEPAQATVVSSKLGILGRIKMFPSSYWRHKKLSFPLTLVILVIVVLAVPLLRYDALGLFLKQTEQVTVVDSTTGSPVSGAKLQIGGVSATTSAKGVATLRTAVGYGNVTVSKQYYKNSVVKVLVSYSKAKNSVKVHLVATGRLVPIVVVNKISGKPVSDAELSVLDTETKTDKNGKAIIALPVGKTTEQGTVTASGYNKGQVTVQVTGQAVTANTFVLTPSGSVYFLSNLSGNIDVVKTNLDGSDRKTVLAGTGNEDPQNTTLLASRDWKYLALLTQRKATGNPELDLIDTSTDTMSNIDEGNANFILIGWDGDSFIYQVNRNNVQVWQNGQEVLKSFSAVTKKLTVLSQTSANGNENSYYGQNFGNSYILGSKIVYALNWSTNQFYSTLTWQQAALNSVNADGSDATTLKNFGIPKQAAAYDLTLSVEPYDGNNSLAIEFSGDSNFNNFDPSFYTYENGKVSPAPDINNQNFYKSFYPTYLLSPSGNQTFWSIQQDGKNTLSVGDQDGNNGKKNATLSDYSPYGWYTDNYLLVSKNNSELYIMPTSGGTPQKISDFFRSSQVIRGYGGGY